MEWCAKGSGSAQLVTAWINRKMTSLTAVMKPEKTAATAIAECGELSTTLSFFKQTPFDNKTISVYAVIKVLSRTFLRCKCASYMRAFFFPSRGLKVGTGYMQGWIICTKLQYVHNTSNSSDTIVQNRNWPYLHQFPVVKYSSS